jgi:L-ribulose-5-phosphate 4-epimerase
MYSELKRKVLQANLDLVKYDLVTLTWGNVSGIDRDRRIIAIKPSGIPYEELKPEQIMVLDLEGKIVEGSLNPSSDTSTHLFLYNAFPDIAGITHTHSAYATMFAQACREIPCLGTTHADHFKGTIPCTRFLTEAEVRENYEKNTGKIIAERFKGLNPVDLPAVLVAGHGPFSWGRSPQESVKNSLILEKVAKMTLGTMLIDPQTKGLPDYILMKHYLRKQGPQAYYGQKK